MSKIVEDSDKKIITVHFLLLRKNVAVAVVKLCRSMRVMNQSIILFE